MDAYVIEDREPHNARERDRCPAAIVRSCNSLWIDQRRRDGNVTVKQIAVLAASNPQRESPASISALNSLSIRFLG